MNAHSCKIVVFRWLGATVVAAALLLLPAFAEDRLWVDAKINGQPVRLIFDTGASDSVLFQKTVNRLHLKAATPTDPDAAAPGTIRMGVVEDCMLSIWGSKMKARFAVFKIPDASYLHTEADGVLGWWNFSDNVFYIDGGASRISPPLERVPEAAKKWQKFQIRTNSALLVLEYPGGEHNNSIVVDTGSDRGVALSPDGWREWKSQHPKQPTTLNAKFTPGSGVKVFEESWAERINIGPLALTNVPVTEAYPAQVLAGTPNFKAAIGLAALKSVAMVVDGEHGVAYVHVGLRQAQPYDHNRLGAIFLPANDDSNDLVAHVAKGSPAWEAGFRDGDILLKFDDTDAAKWKTDPDVDPFKIVTGPAGTKLRLTLRRGTTTNVTTATLRNILGPDVGKDLRTR